MGLLPVSPDAAEGFYRLVDAACERRAMAVGSKLHPGFDEDHAHNAGHRDRPSAAARRPHVVVTHGDRVRQRTHLRDKVSSPLRQPRAGARPLC